MSMPSPAIFIRFRGVRGSHPAPEKSVLVHGGNTTCHEIRAGGRLIIIDGGTGIIPLGNELAKQGTPVHAALLFSHTHYDHLAGFLHFAPAYEKTTRLDIFGPENIEKKLVSATGPSFHPVPLNAMPMSFACRETGDRDVIRWSPGKPRPEIASPRARFRPGDVIVRVMRNPRHPASGVLNFRVEHLGKSYVFATDVEVDANGDEELAAFAAGADLLAHDAQFTEREYYDPASPRLGWGHSTFQGAVATARLANAKRLAIIHHDPERGDGALSRIGEKMRRDFRNSFMARENQRISL